MRILFDQGTPVPLRDVLISHQNSTAYELGWAMLKNGELLSSAEAQGFEVLVTTDSNLHQQNLARCKLAVVVLSTTSWPRIKAAIPLLQSVIDAACPGSYAKVVIP